MRLVDRFLVGVVGEASERFDRRRILVLGAGASALAALSFTAHRFFVDPSPGLAHLNVGASAVVMGLAPVVMRWTGSYRLAAHLLLAALTAMVFVDAVLLGGSTAASVYAVLVIPLMASFYLGQAAGVGYGATQGLSLVALYVVTASGWLPEPALPMEHAADMHLNGAMGILAFIVIFSWIYDAERAAAARRQAALVENLVDGVIEVDLNAKVRTANHQAVEILGRELPMGTSVAELVDGSLGELVIRAWGTREVVKDEVELADGVLCEVQAGPILVDAERHDGAVLILRDVTIERSVDRMKTEFISTVSHELRTPMTSVLGFAKVIRNQLDGRVLPAVDPDDARAARAIPKIQHNLEIITAEGERLTAMINDLLDIAKMEAGSMEWEKTGVDPVDLAQRAVDATTGLFEGRDVALVSEVSDDLPGLHGDSDLLLRVLINLISNASKFTETGSVTLRVEGAEDGVQFSVVDTGPGIPAEALVRVFERFQQVTGHAKDAPKGTGLGLAIAREIAGAHGGRLTVESVVGEGATFRLWLPPA